MIAQLFPQQGTILDHYSVEGVKTMNPFQTAEEIRADD